MQLLLLFRIICILRLLWHLSTDIIFSVRSLWPRVWKTVSGSKQRSRRLGQFGVEHGSVYPLAGMLRFIQLLQSCDTLDIVRSGKLINIVQVEPVGYYHFAHSYVRGNWAKEKQSSFSLMTESCQCVQLLHTQSFKLKPTVLVYRSSLQMGCTRDAGASIIIWLATTLP
jgi:hypothetical protein